MRTLVVASLALLVLSGCDRDAPDALPGPCDIVPDASCGTNHPGPGIGSGGGGGGDGGVMDAGVTDVGPVTINTQVILANGLPVGTGPDASTPAAGWTVDSILPGTMSSGAVVTDATGAATLTNVPVGTLGVLLRATPPAGSQALGALGEGVPPSTVSNLTIVALPVTVLTDAATLAGVAVDLAAAQAVIQLTGLSVAGTTAQLEAGVTATVLYDNNANGGFTTVGPTGTRGTILILNDAPVAGGQYRTVRLTRAGVTEVLQVFMLAGHANYVAPPAP